MESQNKHLKSIFFNFLLLLAFIFSLMALYISLGFSEKINEQGQDTREDDLSFELQELNKTIVELEKMVSDQADSVKMMQNEIVQLEKKVAKTPLESAKNEPAVVQNRAQNSIRYHVIQSGETFSKVSKIYGVSLHALMKANKNLNPKALRVGQEIVIP